MTTPGRLRSGRLFPAPSANPSNSSQQNLPKYRKEMTDREIVQLWMDSAAPATFRVKRLFADAEVKLTNRGSIADEASAIQLVTERTKIPIPEILRTVEDRGDGYIIMDYKGPRLSDVWGSLTKEQRTSIVLILRGYIDQLRAIEPQDFPGPVSDNPTLCHCLQFHEIMRGPFPDYDSSKSSSTKWNIFAVRKTSKKLN